VEWVNSVQTGIAATAGTIMLAAMPTLVGIQLLLSFLSLDMARPEVRPLWKRIARVAAGNLDSVHSE
jgi:hypothetical protein